MIITSTRIAAGDSGAALAHVLDKTAENELIELHDGLRDEIQDWDLDATEAGKKYGLRHLTINPARPITADEAREIVADWQAEMGCQGTAFALIEHHKARADGGLADQHWHVLMPEYDPVRRRVLPSAWSYAKQETVARLAEARLGENVVPGWWALAAASALEARGEAELATRIRDAQPEERPGSAYTREQHQRAKRLGIDLAQVRQVVREAWQASDGPAALRAALDEHDLEIVPGDKPGRWIVRDFETEEFVGALHRLAGVRVAAVDARMSQPEPPPQEAPAPAPEPDLAPIVTTPEPEPVSLTVHPAEPATAPNTGLSLSQAGVDLAAIRSRPTSSLAQPGGGASLASVSIGGTVTAGSGGGGGGGDGECPSSPGANAPKSAWVAWRARVSDWLQRKAQALMSAARAGLAADQARIAAEIAATQAAQRAASTVWAQGWIEMGRTADARHRRDLGPQSYRGGLRYGR